MRALPALMGLALLLLAPPAPAQTTSPLTSPSISDRLDRERLTEAERQALEIILEDGLHVVHFWAPWCVNSTNELRRGFYQIVENSPDVSFTFVTIWNDGESGRQVLDRFGLPERVREVVQPDLGPREDEHLLRRVFLGLPVTWIPTTWVFHRNGELAFAFNYGELQPGQLEQALEAARARW